MGKTVYSTVGFLIPGSRHFTVKKQGCRFEGPTISAERLGFMAFRIR